MKIISKEQAVLKVTSNSNIFFQGAAMTPNILIDELCEQYHRLQNINIIQIHTEGDAKYVKPPYNKTFNLISFFVGSNVRAAVNSKNGDYVPVFLSEIHRLFNTAYYPLDVVFIQVSEPDKHGYCSLGVSVDVTLAAIKASKLVIAQINPNVPRTHGDGIIHINQIDYGVKIASKIHCFKTTEPSEIEAKIGYHVANLVEDGATLQMGIGNIPNAVLANLNNHKRLGIHTEMFSDGILPLVENGVITGEEKLIKKGKIVTCFAVGTQKLYDFIDDNPIVDFKEASYTNAVFNIKANPKVTAINSAIEIDLTGQICADTIGGYQFSGVGGQMDFIRGATLSEGGKPIIAIPSITKKGVSKIVPFLKHGAGVTTTRAHINYVATEFGIVSLFGKSLKERAKALISIAHPLHQENLEREAYQRFNNPAYK